MGACDRHWQWPPAAPWEARWSPTPRASPVSLAAFPVTQAEFRSRPAQSGPGLSTMWRPRGTISALISGLSTGSRSVLSAPALSPEVNGPSATSDGQRR